MNLTPGPREPRTRSGSAVTPSSYCFRVGGSAWILLAGIALLSFIGHHLVGWGVEHGAWPMLEMVLGGGGVACFMAGGILRLWERRSASFHSCHPERSEGSGRSAGLESWSDPSLCSG